MIFLRFPRECRIMPSSTMKNPPLSVRRYLPFIVWPGVAVGIATRCGVYGPGIESRRRRNFLHQSSPSLWYGGYGVCFPGVKRPSRGVDHPPPSRAEVKERVELYFLLPLSSLHGLF